MQKKKKLKTKKLENQPRDQKVGPVKKMTSQPKRRLPPSIRGKRKKLAGSEIKRGAGEKLVREIFFFQIPLCQLLFVKRKRTQASAGIICSRVKSCK